MDDFAVTSVGLDGRSNLMWRYKADMILPDHQRRIVSSEHIPEKVAYTRLETDPCERGTIGCSIAHTRDSNCETW